MILLLFILYFWTVWVAGNTLHIADIIIIQGQIWKQKNEFHNATEEWDKQIPFEESQ